MIKDLKQGKKLVLPSMLYNPTEEYKNKYKDMGYREIQNG